VVPTGAAVDTAVRAGVTVMVEAGMCPAVAAAGRCAFCVACAMICTAAASVALAAATVAAAEALSFDGSSDKGRTQPVNTSRPMIANATLAVRIRVFMVGFSFRCSVQRIAL